MYAARWAARDLGIFSTRPLAVGQTRTKGAHDRGSGRGCEPRTHGVQQPRAADPVCTRKIDR